MSGNFYEVILDGGGPWGIRLQGGKDFGIPLNVARVTPGSKAGNKGILAGDTIVEINGVKTEGLIHTEAQNHIKNAGSRLQLKLKTGKGVSLGDIKQVGSGGFSAQPSKTLYTTDVTHSAGVDHKFNAKPKAFGAATASSGTTVQAKKFDPAEYAKRKKAELDQYKEDQKKPVAPDSDVLKMLQNTTVSETQPGGGSFSRLQNQLNNEGQWAEQEKSFRMTADGTDLVGVSPGSRQVMDEIRDYGSAGLSKSGRPSGGSKSFKFLQQMTDEDEDLPPPPPELMGADDYGLNSKGQSGLQSGTFNRMQAQIDAGKGDQIATVFSQPPGQRNQAVPAAPRVNISSRPTPVTVNPVPKAPMPTGPNFKVGRASAPTFKPPPSSFNQSKGPPPPAVNASEVVNTNSRGFQPGSFGSPSVSSGYSSPPSHNFSSPSGGGRGVGGGIGSPSAGYNSPRAPANPPRAPSQPINSGSEKELYCHACQQPLTGPFVSAIGKTWHPDHFCCSACNVSLQNQAFVEENNQLFCEKCYNSYYAPKCAHCNNAIIGEKPTDLICGQCTSVSANAGMFDPIVCSQSINWLINQIREANTEYESAMSAKTEAMDRIQFTKVKINTMQKQRLSIEADIEECDREYGVTKQAVEYKEKVNAANANMWGRVVDRTEQIARVENNLNVSRKKLTDWKAKLTPLLEEYNKKKARLHNLWKQQQQSQANATNARQFQNELDEMVHRAKVLKGKREFREHKLNAMIQELQSLQELMKDAETRTLLSEQHVASLDLYKETLLEEYTQVRIMRLDALDNLQASKRKLAELKRKNHIYF